VPLIAPDKRHQQESIKARIGGCPEFVEAKFHRPVLGKGFLRAGSEQIVVPGKGFAEIAVCELPIARMVQAVKIWCDNEIAQTPLDRSRDVNIAVGKNPSYRTQHLVGDNGICWKSEQQDCRYSDRDNNQKLQRVGSVGGCEVELSITVVDSVDGPEPGKFMKCTVKQIGDEFEHQYCHYQTRPKTNIESAKQTAQVFFRPPGYKSGNHQEGPIDQHLVDQYQTDIVCPSVSHAGGFGSSRRYGFHEGCQYKRPKHCRKKQAGFVGYKKAVQR